MDSLTGGNDSGNNNEAYFAAIDIIIRRQLDSVWYTVGQRTKDLVEDIKTLRQLLR